MLTYKNYSGMIEYDSDRKIFTGEVIGLRDVITFQGESPEELENSFRDSIDLYLEMCQRDGVQPERPDSGSRNCMFSQETAKLDQIEEQQMANEFLSSEAEWDNY